MLIKRQAARLSKGSRDFSPTIHMVITMIYVIMYVIAEGSYVNEAHCTYTKVASLLTDHFLWAIEIEIAVR